MKEALMEIELLYKKIEEVNRDVEKELKNEELPFGKVLVAILNRTTKTELFNMSDEELVNHIRKIQILES